MKITRYLWLIIVLMTSFESLAEEPTVILCGKSKASLYNSQVQESPYFVLKINSQLGTTYTSFYVDKEHFALRCDADVSGKPMLIATHTCGGTSCSELSYAIFNTQDGKQLLENPRDRTMPNEAQASELLGHQIKGFNCAKPTKTSKAISNQIGEYCYMSPLELG